MVDFEVKQVKQNVYQLIVRQKGQITDVFERQDWRDERAVKIGLAAFSLPGLIRLGVISFDDMNVDRLMFC